ncbi:MAG: M20/M25/M40 family metallo-hydrolase [Symbiobacteriia bacterium]
MSTGQLTTRDFLKAMSAATGVSGHETEVAGVVAAGFEPFCDQVDRGRLGDVIGVRRGALPAGRRPKVLLAAHMDEVGLMVTKIDEGGFLRVTQVGGVDPRTVQAQEVLVHGRETLPGVVGAKPPHLTSPEEAKKAPGYEDLYIDLALPEADVRRLVQVGDLATIRREPLDLLNGAIAGKAMDDRACVAVLYECLQELQHVQFQAEVLAVASTAEEVTSAGATTVTFDRLPDIAIAVDVTFADQPGTAEDHTWSPAKGPVLTMGPNISPRVFEGLQAAAKSLEMDVQLEAAPSHTGTDAWSMQMVAGGIPTAVVSVPIKYMHTSVETLTLENVVRAGRLLARFITQVDEAFVKGLVWQ